MDKNGLKVNELAAEIGETTHVIRNWVRDFRDLIPITKNPAGFNIFTEDAIKVMKQIQRMSRQQKIFDETDPVLFIERRPHIVGHDPGRSSDRGYKKNA